MQQYKKNLGKVSLTAEGAWYGSKDYDILSIVYDEHTQHGFISRQAVPKGVDLYNKEYWMPFNVSGYADNNVIILSKKTAEHAIQSYTLEEAIASIKSVGRRPGAILGFYNENADRLDIGGRWELWQFNDTNIYNWDNVDSWQNLYYNYNKFMGWFKDENFLTKYAPFPEIGCYAFVGSEFNEATVYRCDNKYVWKNTTQHAWDYVKVVIHGNVTVGENGNWFNNGEDTGIPASVKGENGKTPVFREKDNTIQYSFDNVNWITISDKVAAWFRWNATTGDTQANNVGRIQISRDGVTWINFSGDIINNLHISRYIGVDESLPTSGIAEGTIYAKGPYYAEDDVSHANPIYRLWVYAWKGNTLAWQDNGEFTSIAAGVVQETGDSETEVMSQKAVTEKLSELGSTMKHINYLDLTPDSTGKYYSAGGVLSDSPNYASKEVNLIPYTGKYLKLRLGYSKSISSYCFIKTSSGAYLSLSNNLFLANDNYCVLYVKDSFSTLQASWDMKDNPSYFISVIDIFLNSEEIRNIEFGSDYDSIVNGEMLLQTNTLKANLKYINNEILGYYNNNNILKEDSNWKSTTISVKKGTLLKFNSDIVPKTVRAIAVYEEDTLVYSNTYPLMFRSEGSIVNINFSYYARRDCTIVLSYYRDTLSIYETFNSNNFYKDIINNSSILYSADLNYPDNYNKYYSEGNTLIDFNNYNSKEVNVAEFGSKKLYIRCGFKGFYCNYCFVKLYDNTFKPLSDYIVEQNDTYNIVELPQNSLTLQLSWDCKNLDYYYYAVIITNKDVDNRIATIENQINGFFDISTDLLSDVVWDYGSYWSDGGEKDSHKNYKSTSIDVTNYQGKPLFVSVGYGRPDNVYGYLEYSFIKKTDGTYVKIRNLQCILEENRNGYYVTMPSDAETLDVSCDVISKKPINPIVSYITKGKVSELESKIEESNSESSKFKGKNIFLFGDSISSTDYNWYKDYLKEYTGADNVYNQGASGRNAAYQASNEYFNRLKTYPSDIIVALVGGNDSGASGTIGTFSENSELAQLGESVVTETDIIIDYNGSKFIQAISHIIRKWKAEYYNFRLNANLNAKIVASSDTSTTLYEGTEKECIEYANTQGWEVGYGKSYYMISTETDDSKRTKLVSVKMPKLYFCTTLPQKRYDASNAFSKAENWERKRLAVIECCKKYEIPCIDLAKEFAIDWNKEPFWPGQGYSGTSKTDNQGIYTMDGLHPNEFGYDWIARIILKHI